MKTEQATYTQEEAEKLIKQDREFQAQVLRALPTLSAEVKQDWIGNPKGLQKLLKALCPTEGDTPFKTWKTIKLGTGLKTPDDFRKALKKGNNEIGTWADDILGKPAFTASETETNANLVLVSVGELGFKRGATRADIYARAQELGLQLCPAEVGPQLRLQYTDQPRNNLVIIGMEPITDSDGDLRVFHVERHEDGEQWLSTYFGADDVLDAGNRFVFLSRK